MQLMLLEQQSKRRQMEQRDVHWMADVEVLDHNPEELLALLKRQQAVREGLVRGSKG